MQKAQTPMFLYCRERKLVAPLCWKCVRGLRTTMSEKSSLYIFLLWRCTKIAHSLKSQLLLRTFIKKNTFDEVITGKSISFSVRVVRDVREHKAKLRVRGNEYPCEMVSGWGGLVGKGMATKPNKTGRPTMSILWVDYEWIRPTVIRKPFKNYWARGWAKEALVLR